MRARLLVVLCALVLCLALCARDGTACATPTAPGLDVCPVSGRPATALRTPLRIADRYFEVATCSEQCLEVLRASGDLGGSYALLPGFHEGASGVHLLHPATLQRLQFAPEVAEPSPRSEPLLFHAEERMRMKPTMSMIKRIAATPMIGPRTIQFISSLTV